MVSRGAGLGVAPKLKGADVAGVLLAPGAFTSAGLVNENDVVGVAAFAVLLPSFEPVLASEDAKKFGMGPSLRWSDVDKEGEEDSFTAAKGALKKSDAGALLVDWKLKRGFDADVGCSLALSGAVKENKGAVDLAVSVEV